MSYDWLLKLFKELASSGLQQQQKKQADSELSKCKAKVTDLEADLAFYKPNYRFDTSKLVPRSGTMALELIKSSLPSLDFHQPLKEFYDIPTYQQIHEWLRTDLLSNRVWQKSWNCVQFAVASFFFVHEITREQDIRIPYGICYGYMRPGDVTSYHAYNAAIVQTGSGAIQVVLVEPQNDAIYHATIQVPFPYDTRVLQL